MAGRFCSQCAEPLQENASYCSACAAPTSNAGGVVESLSSVTNDKKPIKLVLTPLALIIFGVGLAVALWQATVIIGLGLEL